MEETCALRAQQWWFESTHPYFMKNKGAYMIDRFETCCPNCPAEKEEKKENQENQELPHLYTTWEEYWSNGKHGFSSCCRDLAKEIWDDFEPTIKANRSDWEKLLVNETIKLRKKYVQDLRDMHEYLTKFDLEKLAGISFFRWLLDKTLSEESICSEEYTSAGCKETGKPCNYCKDA